MFRPTRSRRYPAPLHTSAALAVAVLFGLPAAAQADLAITDEVSAYGDVRGGYFHTRRDERDSRTDKTDDWRLRLRAGLKWQPDDRWTFAARFAGRFSTDQDGTRFTMDPYVTTASGLALGESTLDELYADYSVGNNSFRVGRFQVVYDLDGVPRKSLDRNDSSNTEITWTDGVSWIHRLDHGWETRLIIEHNHRNGPANVKQAPLNFRHSDARWSGFAALDNNEPWGVVVQRSISVTWLPDALYPHGVMAGDRDDYWAFAARTALRWPIADTGSAFQLGLEGSYAPDTPYRHTVGLPGSGDTDGTAWQIVLNWLDFAPDHSIGLAAGRAEAGWLLSPDFAPNNDLLELRYRWKVDDIQTFEARVRQRSELDRLAGAPEKREDVDIYLRYAVSF